MARPQCNWHTPCFQFCEVCGLATIYKSNVANLAKRSGRKVELFEKYSFVLATSTVQMWRLWLSLLRNGDSCKQIPKKHFLYNFTNEIFFPRHSAKICLNIVSTWYCFWAHSLLSQTHLVTISVFLQAVLIF